MVLASPAPFADVRSRVSAIFVGSIGNLVEWYDFYAYSAFALYFAGAFFPGTDPIVQQLNAAVLFALGFIPVVGLIPGIIHYRLVLVAPYRRYLPRRTTLLLRWGVRLVSLGLIAFQWVPVIGGLSIPAMALLNHTVYRNRFLELTHRTQHPAPAELQTASLG